MRIEIIEWIQESATFNYETQEQTLRFFGYVHGKKMYCWWISWTFEAMDEVIDLCISETIKFFKNNTIKIHDDINFFTYAG